MFTIFGGTEARRLPGRFQVPWGKIRLTAIVLIVVVLALGVVARFPAFTSRDNIAPAVPGVSQPVAQPAQNIPEAVAPVVPHLNWVEIGQARNGNEVLALPIPWNRLVMLPVKPENRALWLKIGKLNPPPASTDQKLEAIHTAGNGGTGWAGYLVENDKVIMYGVSDYRWTEQDPFVLSYWKAEVKLSEIEGLSP